MSAVARAGERGSAIVVALLMMTLFLMLSGAFLATSLGDGLVASNQVAATRAFHLAEAGLEHARVGIDAAAIDAALDGDGWLLVDEPLGTGSYSVRVSNNVAPGFPLAGIDADPGGPDDDTDGYVVLTSTGEFRRASRTLRQVVGRDRSPWAGFGVFGTDFVSAQGPGVFRGEVGSDHDITLRSDLIGDAVVGGVVNFPERVSGTIVEGEPRRRPNGLQCPTDYGPAPTGDDVDFNPISGDLRLGDDDVTLASGAYFFNKIVKNGSGRIVVPSGNRVELYVKSDIFAEGDTFDTRSGSPADLLLLGCSESAGISAAAPEWRIAPDSTFFGTVFAPTHRLRLYGDGDKAGVFVGKSIYKVGRGDIVHVPTGGGGGPGYDGGSSAGARVVPGTWTSL